MTTAQPAPAQPGPLSPLAARLAILPADPAVLVVDSAYQIVTMIGANPRAIRPILAQRRLTKDQVLEAAGSALDRSAVSLETLDAMMEERRGAHETTAQALRARLDAQPSEEAGGAAERLRGELEAAAADFARFESGQRGARGFLTQLQERATEVQRVYGLL